MSNVLIVRPIARADFAQWEPLWAGYNKFYGRDALPAEITQMTWFRFFDDYEPVLAPAREARRNGSGRQLGNPIKAGEALLAVLEDPRPPRHLVLGSDALRLVAEGRQEVQADIDRFEQLSRSTDFADGYQMAS